MTITTTTTTTVTTTTTTRTKTTINHHCLARRLDPLYRALEKRDRGDVAGLIV